MKNRIWLLASPALVCIGGGAFAQSAAPMTPDRGATGAKTAPSEATIDDIIVTAQRRDESLSRTPVAVAVVSADALAKANIVSEQDLR